MELIAIDGNSLMFRAYYAMPGMSNKEGKPTGAVHGFLAMLMNLIERKPDYLLVGFDMHTPTFRHEQYPEYKAGRRETPEELRAQFPMLKNILREMGIAVIECERYEADDILGTFSRRANGDGVNALLVTGDRDALQLVNEKTHVLMTKKGVTETTEYDEARLMEEYGLDPAHMVDLKGLMGDNSDNLPGIKGVGEKTALKLLAKYGSLENVLNNADNEKGALRDKLISGRESALMSYRLGKIDTAAPVAEPLSDCKFSLSSLSKALPTLNELELRAIIKKLRTLIGEASMTAPAPTELKIEKIVLRDENDLKTAVKEASKCAFFAVNIGSDAISFCAFSGDAAPGREYSLTLGGTLLEPGFDPSQVLYELKPIFEDANISKTVFDGKGLMTLLSHYGIKLNNLGFDVMIADYLLNSLHPAKDLRTLAEEMGLSTFGAAALCFLEKSLGEKLRDNGMEELYREVELPLVTVLYDMERTGFRVDSEVLIQLQKQLSERSLELENEIYEQAGEKFNILSPKQLGHILFEKLMLPPKKKTKTGYSTDNDVLESIKELHPIVPLITEYRFTTKLRSTFIDAMLDKVDDTGRIHTTFNQNVTATGRISSQDPNLQNIPVRTELGREIRRAFIASPGNKLVGADYSQIELRVLAHMSGDEALISAFNDGDDIHTRTASEVFGVPKEEVTREMRSAAKAVNFGIVYGISAYGLSEQLGIGPKKAQQYIDRYLDRCSGVRDFMHNAVEMGKQRSYAETIMGRRRQLPEINSANHNTRSFGERVAMNMPIQGSAADIIKVAMVRVSERLKAEGLKAKLILQIHDELIIDTPLDEVERVEKLLGECMCNVVKLSVPLAAEVSSGENWLETK